MTPANSAKIVHRRDKMRILAEATDTTVPAKRSFVLNYPSMKKTALLLLLCLPFLHVNAQSYMDDILKNTCDCVGKVPDSLDTEKFNMALGVCMIQACTPYKKQLKKEYGINIDKLDEDGEKLGRIIGVKMAAYCPDMLLKLTEKSKKTENKNVNESESIKGSIEKIETDLFVVFSVKDETGKTTKFVWLDFVSSALDLPIDYSHLTGRNVEIEYKKEDFFDPKIEQYRQFYVITKFSLAQ